MTDDTPHIPGPGADDPALADAAASIRAIGEDSSPSRSGERPRDLEAGEDD